MTLEIFFVLILHAIAMTLVWTAAIALPTMVVSLTGRLSPAIATDKEPLFGLFTTMLMTLGIVGFLGIYTIDGSLPLNDYVLRVFLPLLAIDLGMAIVSKLWSNESLPRMIVSVPFKLLLLFALGGLDKMIDGLLGSFYL